MDEGNRSVKISTAYGVVDVTFNPGRKSDGRPNAGMEYTASLRCSSEGVVRLTLGTDFTPPCLMAVLPEFDFRAASDVIAELGIWAPAIDTGWTEARPGVYAFVDGVRYGEPTPEELEFMAAFGFTPGARFDLALPMLRAQRAGLTPLAFGPAATEADVDDDPDFQERLDRESVHPAGATGATALTLPTREENVAAVATAADAVVQATALVLPTSDVAEANRRVGLSPEEQVDPPAAPKPRRQRRAARPVGKVEIVSQVLGEPTSERFVPDAAIADVFDVLDATPVAPAAPAPAPESNPFMIEGL